MRPRGRLGAKDSAEGGYNMMPKDENKIQCIKLQQGTAENALRIQNSMVRTVLRVSIYFEFAVTDASTWRAPILAALDNYPERPMCAV